MRRGMVRRLTKDEERRFGFTARVNVESMRYQCPTCGTPVDVMDAGETQATGAVLVEPCGHSVPIEAWPMTQPARDALVRYVKEDDK